MIFLLNISRKLTASNTQVHEIVLNRHDKFYSLFLPLFILLAIMTYGLPIKAFATAPTHFNYKSSIRFAIAHSPALDHYQKQLEISKLKHQNSFAAFLPTLDLQSDQGTGHGSLSQYAGSSSQVSLSATENIYNNGENLTQYKLSDLQQNYNLLSYLQQRDLLIKNIISTYLNYSLAFSSNKLLESQYDLENQQYQEARALYLQGVKTQSDELGLQTKALSTKTQLLSSAQELKTYTTDLLRLLGYRGDEKVTFEPITLDQLPDLTPVKNPGLNASYQKKLLALQERINDLNTNLAQRKYLPQVFITAGGRYGNADYEQGMLSAYDAPKTSGLYAELQFKFNLFDGGTRRRNIAISQAQGMINIDGLNDELLQEKKELQDIISDAESQLNIIKISKILTQSAQLNVNLITQQYKAGTQTYLDLITAITNYYSAKQSLLQASFKLANDIYSSHYYQGTIYRHVVEG